MTGRLMLSTVCTSALCLISSDRTRSIIKVFTTNPNFYLHHCWFVLNDFLCKNNSDGKPMSCHALKKFLYVKSCMLVKSFDKAARLTDTHSPPQLLCSI